MQQCSASICASVASSTHCFKHTLLQAICASVASSKIVSLNLCFCCFKHFVLLLLQTQTALNNLCFCCFENKLLQAVCASVVLAVVKLHWLVAVNFSCLQQLNFIGLQQSNFLACSCSQIGLAAVLPILLTSVKFHLPDTIHRNKTL